MLNDKATIQWLNLVHSSPKFVIQVDGAGNGSVKTVPVVPKNDGEYWISGTTRTKSGLDIKSVFIVDTNSGGSILGVYWRINNNWFDFNDRPAVAAALRLTENQIFPFDWIYDVPIEEDIFHN